MGRDQREEFERRVLALIRDQLDYMDEDNAEGYEIGDFVISCRYWGAPVADDSRRPWDGGPYPGWFANSWVRGSSRSHWVDVEILEDALRSVQAKEARDQQDYEEEIKAEREASDNGEDEAGDND